MEKPQGGEAGCNITKAEWLVRSLGLDRQPLRTCRCKRQLKDFENSLQSDRQKEALARLSSLVDCTSAKVEEGHVFEFE